MEETDYGVYTCGARNIAFVNKPGVAVVNIELRGKGTPSAPINSKILNRGVNWIQIGWKSGFDGGEPQVFELEYRVEDPFSGQINENIVPTHYYFDSKNATKTLYYDVSIKIIRKIGLKRFITYNNIFLNLE